MVQKAIIATTTIAAMTMPAIPPLDIFLDELDELDTTL